MPTSLGFASGTSQKLSLHNAGKAPLQIEVASAPRGVNAHGIKNYILCLALSDDGSFCYERWIDPREVTAVRDAPTKHADFFFQEKLPYDVHTMRRLAEHGTLHESFIGNHAERVAEDE